ncbi:uncharacterized protein LOC141526870 [Cotesia typhae]|uniref:uncharacterized protein LOC141526870 n=1 Tax=Cotesia typhae TaxID=2053667 RepID=UPI003D6983BF
MFIIAPVLLAVGIKIEDTTLSYSSIQRARMLQREDIAKGLNDNFKTHDKYVVHWDGKMLNDLVGSKSVERLPVILTAFGTEQLLGVPKMNSGTADNQTLAILSTLSEWGITNYVKAMCFDTTAVNTGIHNGTCKAIEKTLGRELICAVCAITPGINVSHPWEQKEADDGRRCKVETVDISRLNGRKVL